MKSAYELAMERLEQEAPSAKVSPRQKAEISEIDSTYKAKIAERDVFLRDQIAKAAAAGKDAEVLELQDQLSRDLRRLNRECEEKKEKVRARG